MHGHETKVLICCEAFFSPSFAETCALTTVHINLIVHASYCVICISNILTIRLIPVGTGEKIITRFDCLKVTSLDISINVQPSYLNVPKYFGVH